VLGVGSPPASLIWLPDCGCDACDSGSQDALDELDTQVLGVVTGGFRHLKRGDCSITMIGDGAGQASGLRRRDNMAKILADPRGWDEVAGTSWL
jgi:hypothetical protein